MRRPGLTASSNSMRDANPKWRGKNMEARAAIDIGAASRVAHDSRFRHSDCFRRECGVSDRDDRARPAHLAGPSFAGHFGGLTVRG